MIFIIILIFLLSSTSLAQLTLSLHHFEQQPLRHSLSHQLRRSDIFHSSKLYSHEQSHTAQDYTLSSSTSAFFLPIKVQGITYNLQIDSGSSDFVIKGQYAPGNPSKRYTCNNKCENNPKYVVQYLDGKMQTYEQNLSIVIGASKFIESVLVAYQIDPAYIPLEGIIGLSFTEVAKNPHPTFLQTLINEKVINTYAFGINLNFQTSGRSFISFGEISSDYSKEKLTFVKLTSKIDFVVDVDGILVGGSGLLKIVKGLFDTGNTCISIPSKYSQQILSNFNTDKNKCAFKDQDSSQKFKLLYCKVTNFNDLPNLVISINGSYFNVEKEAYLKVCQKNPNEGETWYCETYIESVESTTLFLGDGFFNRYYTYFDMQNYRIGITRNKQNLTLEKIINNQEFNQSKWSSIQFAQKQEEVGFWQRILNFFKNLF